MPEPLLVTPNGTILTGFGRWRLAVFEGNDEIHCIEYPLSENDSLPFILNHHRPRGGWNAFVRIRLALTLEPYFQEKALDNMRGGGMYKGSTNLSKAERIDVRHQIASAAGTGTGNVSKVKAILLRSHLNVIAALQNGSLTIHRAWQWCSLTKLQQKEEFARYEEERTQRKLLRDFGNPHPRTDLEPAQVIEALRLLATHSPGIAIRKSRNIRTIVILGQDLIESAEYRKDFNRHD